jgi:hypothetical protein
MIANVPGVRLRRVGGVAVLGFCTAAGLCGRCAAQSGADDTPPPATQPQSTHRTTRHYTFHHLPPTTQSTPTTHSTSLTPPSSTQPTPTMPTPTPPANPATDPNPLADPRRDPDFQAIQKARSDAPAKRQLILLACGKYLAHQPPGPLAQEVGALADTLLDQIWWEKIDQLCQRRQDERRKLDDNAARLAAHTGQTNPPANLMDQKAALERELADTLEQLHDLRYLSDQSPPLSDPARMDRLRQARDPQVYQWWKSLEMQKIADSQGAAW